MRPTELRGVRLLVQGGPDAGADARASARTMRVGSAADNDLVLRDPSVSRHHFELRIRKDDVRLVDLGSTNGTSIDDVSVQEASVRPGQRIVVGATTLRVATDDIPLRLLVSSNDRFGRLLGESIVMREVFALLERFAVTDVSVLVQGESGTGKELAAEGLHVGSRRARGPFVIVDCSAIPQNLFESELFGHAKGSFTGAGEERRGLLEEADGGTVFFDEVGELPLEQQAKLLRALEKREIRRVGTNKTRSIDVRVVAATNRDLASEVNRGTFREDLYYRLAVARVTLPPLRARREDLALLVRHMVQQLDPSSIARADEIAAGMRERQFPGNVRELRNAVQIALAMGPDESGEIVPVAPPGDLLDANRYYDLPYADAVEAIVLEFQRAYLAHALAAEDGNISAVARRAAMSRRYLQRVLSRLGVREAVDPGGPEDGA